MNVGIALMPWALAVSAHLSTSTLRNTARGNLAGSCSKNGAIRWHGGHLNQLRFTINALQKLKRWLRTSEVVRLYSPNCCEVDNNKLCARVRHFGLKMCFIFNHSSKAHCLYRIKLTQNWENTTTGMILQNGWQTSSVANNNSYKVAFSLLWNY